LQNTVLLTDQPHLEIGSGPMVNRPAYGCRQKRPKFDSQLRRIVGRWLTYEGAFTAFEGFLRL
jgi:hypothetical protein